MVFQCFTGILFHSIQPDIFKYDIYFFFYLHVTLLPVFNRSRESVFLSFFDSQYILFPCFQLKRRYPNDKSGRFVLHQY